jgi:PEP-CTERM motif
MHTVRLALCLVAAAVSTAAAAAPITFSVGGDDNPSSIQATVDVFRAALGSPNNGNTPGPLAGGRREINWDGGGSTVTTPPVTPFNGFQNTRGASFTTPGLGLSQATPDGLAGHFSNPTYSTTFGAFSPQRLFVPVASNVTDVLFFLPGSNGTMAATVSGFGAVFTDVDLAGQTTISYFDPEGDLLYSASVAGGRVTDGSLSFLGVLFGGGERIARVRIITGNAALGPNDGGLVDVVAMDDYLYSEPVALSTAVPEPSALSLLGLCALALFGLRRVRERT